MGSDGKNEMIIRSQVRAEYARATKAWASKILKEDHTYHIKDTLLIRQNSVPTYLDGVEKKAKVCKSGPETYSKIIDWKENKGMMIPKDARRSFIDDLVKVKKQIPAPNKYEAKARPQSVGYSKFNESKVTILESIAFEKKAIPASNKYNPKKSMSQISKERNVPRQSDKPDTSGCHPTIRITLSKFKTGAPGGKLNDHSIDYNRKRSTNVQFNKDKGRSFVQQKIEHAKKVPGVGQYETLSNLDKVHSCNPLMKRHRT